jgi:hypothetical protein
MMIDPSGLWRMYKVSRSATQGDFRGSYWGASPDAVIDAEVENLREGFLGYTQLLGYQAMLRYKFGPRGLRGGTYEFKLEAGMDPGLGFQQVFDGLFKQLGMPLYLQRAQAALGPTAALSPASLLRTMTQGANRSVAAWATDTTEIVLLRDESAAPLRLNYISRDPLMYENTSDTLLVPSLAA